MWDIWPFVRSECCVDGSVVFWCFSGGADQVHFCSCPLCARLPILFASVALGVYIWILSLTWGVDPYSWLAMSSSFFSLCLISCYVGFWTVVAFPFVGSILFYCCCVYCYNSRSFHDGFPFLVVVLVGLLPVLLNVRISFLSPLRCLSLFAVISCSTLGHLNPMDPFVCELSLTLPENL